MAACPRCSGALAPNGVCPRCGPVRVAPQSSPQPHAQQMPRPPPQQMPRPMTPPPQAMQPTPRAPSTAQPQVFRGSPSPQAYAPPQPPTYTTDQGLILREIVDDAPPPLAMGIILTELPPDDANAPITQGERIPEPPIDMYGFEATRIEDAPEAPLRMRPPKPKPLPKRAPPQTEVFATAACPGCAVALPDPTPSFCEACGYRIPRVKRAGASSAVRNEGDKRCRPCGAKNGASQTRCVDCGAVL